MGWGLTGGSEDLWLDDGRRALAPQAEQGEVNVLLGLLALGIGINVALSVQRLQQCIWG